MTLALEQSPVWWNRQWVRLPNTTKSFCLRNLFKGCITQWQTRNIQGWMLCLRQKSQITPISFHGLWILNEATQSKIRSEAETLGRGCSLEELGSAALDFTRQMSSSDAGKRPCQSVLEEWLQEGHGQGSTERGSCRYRFQSSARQLLLLPSRAGSTLTCLLHPLIAFWHCFCLQCLHFKAKERSREGNSPVEMSAFQKLTFAFLQHIHG